MTIFGIAFTSPWLLLGLLALPILWWLLRAVPPAAREQRFPGVRILLDLEDREKTAGQDAVVAVAAAGCWRWPVRSSLLPVPILNPIVRNLVGGPLLVVMDGGWASAPDWEKRRAWAEGVLQDAGRVGRPVAFQSLGRLQTGQITFGDASDGLERLAVMEPAPYGPDRAGLLEALPDGEFATIWLHDGIARDTDNALLDVLKSRGSVTMINTGGGTQALTAARLDGGMIARRCAARPGEARRGDHGARHGA